MITRLSYESLPGIRSCWHSTVVDFFSITTVEKQINAGVELVKLRSAPADTVIAKFTVFEHRIPNVEHETTICIPAAGRARDRASSQPF